MSSTVTMQAPVICVVGARPNYMKVAPIIRAFAAHNPPIRTLLVHTGQHYDPAMKDRDVLPEALKVMRKLNARMEKLNEEKAAAADGGVQ